MTAEPDIFDIFIIGGGINGVGIARDAAGRGLCVGLAEMGDLASATSSASTKLFHGGLRYLDYFEFRLVREALHEREVLLRAMPHIAWPMRFVLPLSPEMRFDTETPASRLLARVMPWMRGRRPGWMIRLGLFLYDSMGGRHILPATRSLDLATDPAGRPLQARYRKAFEYSDVWVQDSRLVVLNARDAQLRGAQIVTRTRVVSARREGGIWVIRMTGHGGDRVVHARSLVNAAGPWGAQLIHDALGQNSRVRLRLVRGSHIVTRALFDHGKPYFLQGPDGRIIFAIPYEGDFTLIGTTDQDHSGDPSSATCTPEEQDYLCAFASRYFARPVTRDDIVWTYSGVRALYDDGAGSATAATRDYVLSLDDAGAPVLHVFGGKITTYRKLAQAALGRLAPFLPSMRGDWTAGVPLPGGDFPVDGVQVLRDDLLRAYPFVGVDWATRLIRSYGTEAAEMLNGADSMAVLGHDFGATLTEREVRWLLDHEFAQTAEDIVWRRSRLGLHMLPQQIAALQSWIEEQR